MSNDALTEKYIEHEVEIRVHDEKFKMLEHKLNSLIALVISGIFIPVILHWTKII